MQRTRKRLDMVKRHLTSRNQVCIGSVCVPVNTPKAQELVPAPPFHEIPNDIKAHLQWMMKKDSLGQDMFLYGPPGPLKRRIAQQYLNLTQQEAEYIIIHPDTSAESDLKQRREIINGKSGQELLWIDGSCVRAVQNGRCLIIEGIEKAERNVLPVLNNLLENREMTLEDGKHIISYSQYDELLKTHSKEQLDTLGLIRAHEKFRVIAIGTPVPPYPGKPLDPPFRSRFQSRYIDASISESPIITSSQARQFPDLKIGDSTKSLANVVGSIKLGGNTNNQLLSADNLLPAFGQSALEHFNVFENRFPADIQLGLKHTIERFWPNSWMPKALPETLENIYNDLLTKFNLAFRKDKSRAFTHRTHYMFDGVKNGKAMFKQGKEVIGYSVITGDFPAQPSSNFIMSPRCSDILTRMMQSHVLHQDMILVGPKSSSKTFCINEFARVLDYDTVTVNLYRDMTARDFLQRRNTRNDGTTFWQDSPIITAAKQGKIAVLDGVHWIHSEVLAALSRLIQDREITLPDGTFLTNSINYEHMKLNSGFSDQQLAEKKIFCIHPSFRIIATASTDKHQPNFTWFNEEISSMFHFIKIDEMGFEEEKRLIKEQSNCPTEKLELIFNFAHRFRNLANVNGHESILSKSISLSTRQLLRICKRAAFPESDLYTLIMNTCLAPFLPQLGRNALIELLKDCGISKSTSKNLSIEDSLSSISFGDVSVEKYKIRADDLEAKTLIPHTSVNSDGKYERQVKFFENPTHKRVMRDIALDFALGEHLLLIGNQGVGKNKLTDRFLELLEYPREYIQLHRDTTVQSLLVQPVLEHGKIVYKDSPLIKAAQNGRVLVVDEADKAPVYITSILKSLAETGQMDILDGRKIRPLASSTPGDIVLHPDFRMIVLANRPGFPFLGNDFYGAIGEVFGTYPVENPDFNSEVSLLSQLAPSIDIEVIKKLVGAFGDLRKAFDDGLVNYPYSLRELINIVRHKEKFPEEKIETLLRNVFDFDVHRTELTEFLIETFSRHGIQLENISLLSVQAPNKESLAIQYRKEAPPEIEGPKHGKVDEKNEPHVGGNTWAGGTGGSNTAGLGGRGGPYRLDSGNPVHQLPDEVKNQVPQEVLDAARAMGQDALKKKLEDIQMSPFQAEVFDRLSKNVQQQVQQLRIILESVNASKKERIWLKNQTDGEIDDSKLVEGITGEHSIYKRRGHEQSDTTIHELPKRLKFVFDVSGSMYRFNGHDYRLTKSLETAIMIMESLKSLEHKYVYDIVGHSGDSSCIPFVQAGKPPKNEKEMLEVVLQMNAHAQYCWSGDNTISATARAIQDIVLDKADDYFVFVISDANLKRYGISANEFGAILEKDPKVSVTALFIGSIGREAHDLVKKLPKGRSFLATNTADIPRLIKEIFSSVVSK
ncbi:hypothetical protein HK103_006294 [Boothiomyces macroporosus]|uniref:ATPase dynein-related AAA domain-containing protein n=1 Tax=Boothiomyces macroporosus TaxID=261099 RepID=A0AAD5Y250_9FUNG|nr:hypothetical protein HK103_006294 [Boothiomyces macroporosus]